MTDHRLEGRVAEVLNERELVVNIGSTAGVKRGMRFAVLAATALVVRDPDTGAELGTIDREKIRVEATEVEPRFAVCATYEKTVTGRELLGMQSLATITAMTEMFQPRREVYKTLKLSDSSDLPPLPEEE